MDDSKGLACFFLGLGAGVAIGMIFAPQSGSETRGFIKGKANEGADYVKRRSEELRDTAADAVSKSKDVVNRQKDQLSAAVDAGRQAYREAVSSVERTVSSPAPASDL